MKLPDAKFKIEYRDSDGHFYGTGGVWYKSVTHYTQFLGDENKGNAIVGWAKKIALQTAIGGIRERLGQKVEITEDFLQEIYKAGWKKPKEEFAKAGDIGTKCHAAIDAHILGKEPDLSDPMVKQVFENFATWIAKEKYTIISGDVAVISKEYEYGGRVDCILQDNEGRIVVGDFKTCNSVKSEYNGEQVLRSQIALQLSAYCQGISETFGIPLPKKALCIRFDKTKPEFETVELRGIRKWLKLFVAVRNIEGLLEKARS